MRAKFKNGTFEVTEGLAIKTVTGYNGKVCSPDYFAKFGTTYTETNKAPADQIRNLTEEMITEEFHDILVVSLDEKTLGEFGIQNEFKIPAGLLTVIN